MNFKNKKLFYLAITIFFLSQITIRANDLILEADRHLSQKNYKDAKRIYSKLLKKDNKNSDAHRGMGDVLFNSSKSEWNIRKAQTKYEKAIDLDPSNLKAHYGLASCYLLLRESDKIMEEVKIIRAADPNSAESYYKMALANNLLAQDHYFQNKEEVAQMFEAYQKVIELNPDHENAIHNLALEYIRIGRYDDALSILKAYLERHPNDVSELIAIANTFRLKQEYEKTEEYCAKVLSIEGKNSDAKDLIFLAKKGKADRQKLIDLTHQILQSLTKSNIQIEREKAQQILDGHQKEVSTEMISRLKANDEDGMAYFILALASSLLGDATATSENAASAVGCKYKNEFLEEFSKLAFQYDLSLTTAIF